MKLAQFLLKICNNTLPLSFQPLLNKIELVRSHQTRNLTQLKYFSLRVSKTALQEQLQLLGAKLWNEIDEDCNVCMKYRLVIKSLIRMFNYQKFDSSKKCFKEKIIS